MPNRRLALRREALVELTPAQLAVIPAGSGLGCLSIATCSGGTLSIQCTNGPCASDFQECHETHTCA